MAALVAPRLAWRPYDGGPGLMTAELDDGGAILARRTDGRWMPFVVLRSPGAGMMLLGPALSLRKAQQWVADGAAAGEWRDAEEHPCGAVEA
jgi:hypothetical protein